MSTAKRVLTEMALDFGNAPDWIDPEKKRKIQQRQDPLSQNPAWPQQKPNIRPGAPFKEPARPGQPDPTRHYGERIASNAYPEIINKVQRYTGRNPRQMHPGELAPRMMQALMSAMQMERPHRQQLEQAAVRVVLGLPEFRDAAQAIEGGHLRIDAHLVDPQEMHQVGQRRANNPEEEQEEDPMMGRMQVDPEEPGEEEAQEMGLHVPQIKHEFDEEATKRRFVNALTQGAAINKNYAYHEVADELNAIDPRILNLYGTAMSIGELMYWMMPEEMLNQMMGGGGGAGGMEEIEPDDDGVWVVRAYAICFPVLIQEIVKGLYEFLAHNEDDSAEVRSYAYKKSDTLANEQWDIMQGPAMWRHLNHIVNQANGAEYMGRVFRHLVTLPTGEFNRLMRAILEESPEGKKYIRDLVNEIRDEAEGRRQESKAHRLITGIE